MQNTNFTVSGVTFTRCVAARGGALSVLDAHAFVTNCSFVDNHANHGGAIHAAGNAEVALQDVVFTHNDAFNDTIGGGAIHAQDTARVTGFNTQASCNVATLDREDITCAGSASIQLDSAESAACSDTCVVSNTGGQTLCGLAPSCADLAQDAGEIADQPNDDTATCGDDVCDITSETCLTCAQDCSCMSRYPSPALFYIFIIFVLVILNVHLKIRN